jgi:hypothetical protein
MIVFGTRPYGKCDVVPELFYVATWFFHVDYMPLIPTGSRLILGQSGNQYQVVKIPLSFKSILLAWARAAFCVAMIGTGFWAVITMLDAKQARETGLLLPVMVALFCTAIFAFLMLYPRRKMPSYERACKLAAMAGLNERGWAALNVLYGRDPLEKPGNAAQLGNLAQSSRL